MEHPNVYTLGKSGDINNLLLNKNELDEIITLDGLSEALKKSQLSMPICTVKKTQKERSFYLWIAPKGVSKRFLKITLYPWSIPRAR